jgi:ATP-dependent Clp protease ATP-binding subunit ClpA
LRRLSKRGRMWSRWASCRGLPRARKAIEYSVEEAHNLNQNYVGTEHILLGLLREQEGVAGVVLTNLGLTAENTRIEVLRIQARTAGLFD